MSQLIPHSLAWYKKLAALQSSEYRYPWSSTLPDLNGEQAFLDYVSKSMNPNSVVLDAGCAGGSLTLSLANQCKFIYGYDFLPEFIEKAKQNQREGNVTNADFIDHDSSDSSTDPKLPFEENTFDLIVSRRGPTSFITDAPRVLKPGGRMIQLNPSVGQRPEWADMLPEVYHDNLGDKTDFSIQNKIQNRLQQADLEMDACWWFDVPEAFNQPEDLYDFLNWGFFDKKPYSFSELEPVLSEVFSTHCERGGVSVRQRRFLWTSVVYK